MVASLTEKGINSSAQMIFGNPFVGIQDTITKQNVDLVVMGSKGATGLSEILIGSNAERVIRHSKCPVITVKEESDLSKIKGVVLVTNGRVEQDKIVPIIKKFQSLFNLNLHLLRVCTPHNFLSEKEARSQLKDFTERNQLENFTIGTIKAEFADEGIIDFAVKNRIQMIAMGTHGRSGLAHFFGGSIAEEVANHSHIPILTFCIQEKPV